MLSENQMVVVSVLC